MPRLTQSLPKYAKHKQSGQAVVYIDGRDILLGTHGSAASKEKYNGLVAEWLSNTSESCRVRFIIFEGRSFKFRASTFPDSCAELLPTAGTPVGDQVHEQVERKARLQARGCQYDPHPRAKGLGVPAPFP